MELRVHGPARKLHGEVRVPGDKSITHRALLLAGMAGGRSRLQGRLRAGVVAAMEGCLRALGVTIEDLEDGDTLVSGGRWRSPDGPLDCGNSAATMRLLLGALAGGEQSATLTGSARLGQRPMARVIEPLRAMGAQIAGANGSNLPPLRVAGARLQGAEHELRVASAQVKTAILLAGLHADGETGIREPASSRDHSERLLRGLGVPLTLADGRLSLTPVPRPLPAFDLTIPGDFSAAAFTIGLAAGCPGSELTVRGVGVNPTRTGLLAVLTGMGAGWALTNEALRDGEPVADLTIQGGGLRAAEVGAERVASLVDEVPLLVVLATQAEGETRLRGFAELRLKESDRLSSMRRELNKMGAEIGEQPDGLTIHGPTQLRGATVEAHGDHRVAMALAVAGSLARGETTIVGAEVVEESFPEFPATLRSLGVELA